MQAKISKTCTTPRSGVGLDELLGRTSLVLQAFPANRLLRRTHERDLRRVCARCALAEGLRGPQKKPNTLELERLALAQVLESHQTAIFHGCGLTPELSRTAARNGGVVHVTMQPSREAVSA